MQTETTEQGFDFEPAYRAYGYGAIAWRVTGYAQEWTQEEWVYCGEGDEDDESNYFYNEPEQYDDTTRVVAHMIGDDRDFTFDVDDMEPIAREDYCGQCGQIGCAHDGYDRD